MRLRLTLELQLVASHKVVLQFLLASRGTLLPPEALLHEFRCQEVVPFSVFTKVLDWDRETIFRFDICGDESEVRRQ
jgi:hypothetical protein